MHLGNRDYLRATFLVFTVFYGLNTMSLAEELVDPYFPKLEKSSFTWNPAQIKFEQDELANCKSSSLKEVDQRQ